MFRREYSPERLRSYATQAEEAGFDELWLVEDCFYAGGFASAATALASTSRIKVGLGITPAVARNPAFFAMDIATLCRLYPGRFLPGFGHGVADWMRQIGALPGSPLKALEEVTCTVRRLLHGETVTYEGQYVHLQQVRLEFPPEKAPRISLGIRGPKSLTLSGQIADGTILAECSSPAYLSWARKQIGQGQPDQAEHPITVYAMCYVSEDAQMARTELRPVIAAYLARTRVHSQLEPLGIVSQINSMMADGGLQRLQDEMPDEWIDQLAVVGTPSDCRAAIHRLVSAGAQSVVLISHLEQDLHKLICDVL